MLAYCPPWPGNATATLTPASGRPTKTPCACNGAGEARRATIVRSSSTRRASSSGVAATTATRWPVDDCAAASWLCASRARYAAPLLFAASRASTCRSSTQPARSGACAAAMVSAGAASCPAGAASCPAGRGVAGEVAVLAVAGVARGWYSSTIMCMLLPPTPKPLTPARRGRPSLVSQRVSSLATRTGPRDKVDLRVRRLDFSDGGNRPSRTASVAFTSAGTPAGGVEVPDVRLHRADHQRPRAPARRTRACGSTSTSIAERGPGAVTLDVVDSSAASARLGDRALHRQCLALGRRRQHRAAAPVARAGHRAQHGVDALAVALGVREAAQHEARRRLRRDEAVRAGGERARCRAPTAPGSGRRRRRTRAACRTTRRREHDVAGAAGGALLAASSAACVEAHAESTTKCGPWKSKWRAMRAALMLPRKPSSVSSLIGGSPASKRRSASATMARAAAPSTPAAASARSSSSANSRKLTRLSARNLLPWYGRKREHHADAIADPSGRPRSARRRARSSAAPRTSDWPGRSSAAPPAGCAQRASAPGRRRGNSRCACSWCRDGPDRDRSSDRSASARAGSRASASCPSSSGCQNAGTPSAPGKRAAHADDGDRFARRRRHGRTRGRLRDAAVARRACRLARAAVERLQHGVEVVAAEPEGANRRARHRRAADGAERRRLRRDEERRGVELERRVGRREVRSAPGSARA